MDSLSFSYALREVTGFLLSAIVRAEGSANFNLISPNCAVFSPVRERLTICFDCTISNFHHNNGPTYHPRS